MGSTVVPFTDRVRVILIPLVVTRSFEGLLARILKAVRRLHLGSPPLPKGHAYTRWVDRIGRRILSTATTVPARPPPGGGGQDRKLALSERPSVPLPRDLQRAVGASELVVVANASPNAMLVPGSRIIVHSALLRLCDNDDEVAMVLAHEVGHCIARHLSEGIATGFTASFLIYFLKEKLKKRFGNFMAWSVADKLVDVVYLKPRSRSREVCTATISRYISNACMHASACLAFALFARDLRTYTHRPS